MTGTEPDHQADSDSPIVPVQMGNPVVADDILAGATPSSKKRGAVVAVSIALFFTVLTVIFVLPRYIQPDATVSEKTTEHPITKPDKPVATIEPKEPQEFAASRRLAQTQLEQILELDAKLESRNVVEWAADEISSARSKTKVGEKAYREQRYTTANESFADAFELLRSIDSRTNDVVRDATRQGFEYIEAENSAAARKVFNFALAIKPHHPDAVRGLSRAATLDQVLALVREATGYEELGELDKALARYREALSLDRETADAAAAITHIVQLQLDNEFRRVMSQGFSAFDANQDTKAQKAFTIAVRLKPNAMEAKDALNQVKNRILANKISQHLGAAINLAKSEQWTASAAQYRAAVAFDRNLDGATASAIRADARAKLDKQLNSMIGRPHRLADDRVYGEAQTALKRAQLIADAGPRLARQIDQLASAIKVARTPIAITLVSDNATEVTLYKVGPLGSFEQRSVSVIPGRYVVIGRRDGFRDVRIEFDVSPQRRDAMITVRCEQKLAFGDSGQ